MAKAVVLLDQTLDISERFRIELRVFEVVPDDKYPTGIKVSFVLIDLREKVPRLLIDNHEPFGFHVHEELPENKSARRVLKVTDYLLALDEFWRLTNVILDNDGEQK